MILYRPSVLESRRPLLSNIFLFKLVLLNFALAAAASTGKTKPNCLGIDDCNECESEATDCTAGCSQNNTCECDPTGTHKGKTCFHVGYTGPYLDSNYGEQCTECALAFIAATNYINSMNDADRNKNKINPDLVLIPYTEDSSSGESAGYKLRHADKILSDRICDVATVNKIGDNAVVSISDQYSGTVKSMAPMAEFHSAHMIGYGSTSSSLSDRETYPYFNRVCPPDSWQAPAGVNIASKFGWNDVGVIYLDKAYTSDFFKDLSTGFEAVKINYEGLMISPNQIEFESDENLIENSKCNRAELTRKRNLKDCRDEKNGRMCKDSLEKLEKFKVDVEYHIRLKVIYLLASGKEFRQLALMLDAIGMNSEGQYTFIGIDGWMSSTKFDNDNCDLRDIFHGSFGTFPNIASDSDMYKTCMNSLRSESNNGTGLWNQQPYSNLINYTKKDASESEFSWVGMAQKTKKHSTMNKTNFENRANAAQQNEWASYVWDAVLLVATAASDSNVRAECYNENAFKWNKTCFGTKGLRGYVSVENGAVGTTRLARQYNEAYDQIGTKENTGAGERTGSYSVFNVMKCPKNNNGEKNCNAEAALKKVMEVGWSDDFISKNEPRINGVSTPSVTKRTQSPQYVKTPNSAGKCNEPACSSCSPANARFENLNIFSSCLDGIVLVTDLGVEGDGCKMGLPNCNPENLTESTTVQVVGAIVGGIFAGLFVIALLYFFVYRKKAKKVQNQMTEKNAALTTKVGETTKALEKAEKALEEMEKKMSNLVSTSKAWTSDGNIQIKTQLSGGEGGDFFWYWQEEDSKIAKYKSDQVVTVKGKSYVKYPKSVSETFEEHFVSQRACGNFVLNIQGGKGKSGYLVDFDKMSQTNMETKDERRILRHSTDTEMDPYEDENDDGEEDMLDLIDGQLIQIQRRDDDGVMAYGSVIFAEGSAKMTMDKSGWFPIAHTLSPPDHALFTKFNKSIDGNIGGLEPPSHWSEQINSASADFVKVERDTKEFRVLETQFQSSQSPRLNIVGITRIQHVPLFQSYAVKKMTMQHYMDEGQQLEKAYLFHGTDAVTMTKIAQQGFNRSFAGKNMTRYGKGVYFAIKSSYSSHPQYSRPDANGVQRMFMCRVLIGHYCQGVQDARVPDLRDAATNTLYDTTVDSMIDHRRQIRSCLAAAIACASSASICSLVFTPPEKYWSDVSG
eukprot:UC4_evm5s1075